MSEKSAVKAPVKGKKAPESEIKELFSETDEEEIEL